MSSSLVYCKTFQVIVCDIANVSRTRQSIGFQSVLVCERLSGHLAVVMIDILTPKSTFHVDSTMDDTITSYPISRYFTCVLGVM